MEKPANQEQILIVGAGLVGTLLSIFLAKQGYVVTVLEKRPDPRKNLIDKGRSINLALSHRGIRALQEVGLAEKVLNAAVPMYGRIIHSEEGETNFQPYGEQGQHINSISRSGLNKILLDEAERQGVNVLFELSLKILDKEKPEIIAENSEGEILNFTAAVIFGADGAFSFVRHNLQKEAGTVVTEQIMPISYKELTIPAINNMQVLQNNGLHIWPRGDFMLIALPNQDGSFTCTLFLPSKGDESFENIQTEEALYDLFMNHFADVIVVMPSLKEEFFSNPVGTLHTLDCYPWGYKNIMLIGDAAHAIVPFYGQGMNAGFEDCRILDELITTHKGNWETILGNYQTQRKPDTDAIAAFSARNFTEMSELVADEDFLRKKKIESKIHKRFPEYLPQYSMVTFTDMPYSEALKKAEEHEQMMEELMKFKNEFETPAGWQKIETLVKEWMVKKPLVKAS